MGLNLNANGGTYRPGVAKLLEDKLGVAKTRTTSGWCTGSAITLVDDSKIIADVFFI